MLAWLVSLLIAGPTVLAGGPVVHHAHDPRIDCIVQRFGDPEPQRCSSRLVCTTASKHLVGHRMVGARRIAHRYGCTVRTVRRNGHALDVYADFQPNRIDVSVKHGRIVRIVEIG
jgi:hypothetical protein